MRKHLWTLTIPLILILVFTGCSIVSSATEEESEAPARRLDPAAWPTPQPTEVSASPTPFPKITLPPAATPTSLPATLSSESSYTPVQSLKFTGNIAELVQQVTELSGGFPPVAAAAVNSDAVTVRQEPAESAASVGIAEEGELAAILGRNESGDWLYTLTRSGFQGWLPVTSVDITFTLK